MLVKKLHEDAHLPKRGTEKSAGYDLYAYLKEERVIKAGETEMIPTGIAIALPPVTAGLVYARSSLASKKGIAPANCVGVIDEDYRGEVIVPLHNYSKEDFTLKGEERIAQLIITPVLYEEIEETEELSETKRGTGGFGSTGI